MVGHFGFWRQHTPHLSGQLPPMYRLVDWGAEQEKALQNIQATVQDPPPFESYDPTDSMILGQIGIQTSRFRSKSVSSSTDSYSFENQVLATGPWQRLTV